MITFTSWDAELYHFGIRGQTWGRRRYQNEDGSLTEEGKRRYGTRENYERIHNKKRLSEMSDEEIRRAIDRKNLENEYRKAAGGNAAINALNKIGDFYEKRQERSLRREELKVEAEKAKSEAQKAASEAKKAQSEKIKAKAERKKALYQRKTDRKSLRKAGMTASLAEAIAKKNATATKLALAESKANTIKRILEKRYYKKKLTGLDLNDIVKSYSYEADNKNKNK